MPTLTLASLQSRVYSSLDSNSLLYPVADVTNAINEAIKVLNLATAFLQSTVLIPTWSIPNRIYYRTPAPLLFPTRVTFDDRALLPISLDNLGQAYPDWTSQTTATSLMPTTYWIRRGLDRFGIWPADASGGAQIAVTGIVEPTPLINPSDAIGFNNDTLQAFDLYTIHVLQLKESSKTFVQSSQDYQEFEKIVKRTAAWQGLKMPRYWIEELEQE